MKARDLLCEYYDPADDELGQAKMDDTRRPRLTMHHLQKLRKYFIVLNYGLLQNFQKVVQHPV